MADEKKPWEKGLQAETTDTPEVKKPWEQDFATDEKKNSGNSLENNTEKKPASNSQSGSSTSASTNSSSDGFKQGEYDLPESLKNFDIEKIKNLTPEENQKNQREALKERIKPESVKKADLKIKEVNNSIVDVSRSWNQIKTAQKENVKTLTNLKAQLEDPNTPPDQKAQLADVFKQTYDSALQTEEAEKKVREKAIKLQQAKSTLQKVYDVQEKLDMDENDDFLKATGNFLNHVYNALPEAVSGTGALVESFGDVLKHPFEMSGVPTTDYATAYEQFKEDQKDDKITDVIGKAIQNMGNDMKVETDSKYDDKHYISSTIGDIVGSIAVSAIPGSVAAKAGKAAQIVSGATTATMQMADGVHAKAKELGLSDEDAGLMTLSIAPVSGLLEVWGASNIIDNISGKKIINELITESTKKLAGQKVTKELIFETVGDTFKDVAKKYGLNALKSAGEEGITEGLQGEVEKAAENIYDATTDGEPKYGTKFFSADAQLDVAKQAAMGAAAGGVFGAISGISSPKSLYEKAVELKEDPHMLDRFRDMLDTEVKAGHIELEKADEIKANINAMMDADEKVPPAITDINKRFKAVELIKEKTALEEEIKGMDKAITTPQRDRIKVLNSELEAIATGKEPVKMERRDLTKQKEKTEKKPAAETKPQVEAKDELPLKFPLNKDEETELAELERDKRRIGLEGADQERYDELKSRTEVTKTETSRSTDKPEEKYVPKETSETTVFPKQKKKVAPKAEEKTAEPSLVVKAEETPKSSERDAFVKEKIKKLKAEAKKGTADYDKALEPVYKKKFENEYELLNHEQKLSEDETEHESIIEQLPEADDVEQEPDVKAIEQKEIPSTSEGIDEEIAKIDEIVKKNTHPLKGKLPAEFQKALKQDTSTAYDKVMQHFIGGGKVHTSAIDELYGGGTNGKNKAASERKIRESYLDKKPVTGKSKSFSALDDLAHTLWENQEHKQFDTQDFRNAIEQVLSDHTSRKSMVKLMNDRVEKESEAMNEEAAARSAAEESGKNEQVEEKQKEEPSPESKIEEDEGTVFTGDGKDDGLPFQKVLSSDKYTKSQKRVAKSISNVVKALSKIAPGLKVVLHESEDTFKHAAYEANKKLGLSEKRAKKDVGGRAFYFGKNDHVIHVNLSEVKSNTLFHEGTHPILNVVEELRPGTIDAMFDQLIGIEKAIGQPGKYTEDFAGAYAESVRKLEAVTEFIADVADGKVEIVEGNLQKVKQFFAKLLRFLGIDIKKFSAEDIVSLAKKIQKGFEKGEAIELETNRALRDIVFGRYQQKTLAAIELEKQVAAAESELKAATTAFDKKRKELDTEIVNDQEDLFGERKSTPGGGMFDERVDLSARDKVIEPFKVRLQKAKDNLATLKKKLQDEEGKQDLLLFQKPENTDNISEEDIKWALKTFKKLGNDFEKFREKLSTTEEGRDLLSKNLFGAMLEYNSEKPQASKSDRIRAVADSLYKSTFIPEELKDKIKENSLRDDVFSHEEARDIADTAIKVLGVDGAVDLASGKDSYLKGSVKAFVYGAAIDYYAKKVTEATNTFEKDSYAQRGADIAESFQKDAENYGRFISAIGEYYKNSPLIIQKTEMNKLRTKAKEALEKMKRTVNKVKSVNKEFNTTVKRDIKEPQEGTPRKKLASGAARASKRAELLERWKTLNSGKPGIQKQVSGYTQEQTDIMVEMGAIHVADGAWTFPSWSKKMKEDFGISEKTAREVWEKEKMPADLDDAQRTLSQMVTEDLGDTEEYKEQQEKILEKYFPPKVTKDKAKQKEEHEKIIEQYNAGVFGDGKNTEGEEFQKLFFDKLGIVNPDAPEVKARIGEFAEKIAAAPEGSVFQREAQEDMLTYIAQLAYRSKIESGASKISSIWYANILSSPGTHLRNFQYNTITAAISQPALLLEKSLLKGDYKAIGTHMRGFVEGVKKGIAEAGRVVKTGRGSRFDNVTAKSELERGKYIKPFVVPGRGLKASDILFTDIAYNTKLSDLARQLVMKEHPDYNNEQINVAVNELLGNTKERKEAAIAQAEKEMTEFYGADWKTKKGASNVFKIRQFELMEQSIPEDMKEDAVKWSKKSLLTSRPTGVLGVVADGINKWNERLYFTKFIVPFVNVPFNLVNAIIDRSPLGLITAIRRAEGFRDYKTELTDDEVKELYIKIVNYAVATAVLAAVNGDDDNDPLVITGAQTGDYMDNKGVIRGGGLEPYSVYVFGKKVMGYKTTPWAAALLIPGYSRDARLYGKSSDMTDIAAYSGLNWLLFINDQSAMQGVQGLVSTVAESKKMNAETAYTTVAKYLQNVIVPYSGALKFVNNNTKALLGANDQRPIDPWEYLTKDVPFADQLARTRKDHFGQSVKESFDIPLLPAGHRGLLAEMSEVSPYYKMCKDKGYYPAFSTQRKMYIDGVEKNISKKELDDINTDRGQLVKKALDSKNVFVPKDDADTDEKLAEMTTMQYLKTLDNAEFKKRMDDLFNEATKLARVRKYGEKVGITPKDVDKARAALEEYGSDYEQPKEEANKRLKEEYGENGTIHIAIDAY